MLAQCSAFATQCPVGVGYYACLDAAVPIISPQDLFRLRRNSQLYRITIWQPVRHFPGRENECLLVLERMDVAARQFLLRHCHVVPVCLSKRIDVDEWEWIVELMSLPRHAPVLPRQAVF